MTRCQSLFAGLLVGLLVLSGQAMAFARGASPAETRVVICVGHLSKAIYVDADGQQTAPPELCADCAHLFVAVAFGSVSAARPSGYGIQVSAPPHVGFEPGTIPGTYPARAPPGAVTFS